LRRNIGHIVAAFTLNVIPAEAKRSAGMTE